MKKILVTGGAGFIGSSLCKKLTDLNYYVIALDNLQTGSLENIQSIKNNFEFIKGDVNQKTDVEQVFSKFNPDYVYHYAACVGVARTLSKPMEVLSDIDGIKNILELATKHKVKRVFYSSSSEVYGEPVGFPQNEEKTPLNSKLTYAVVKNLGEVMYKAYNKEFGLPYTIFRFFNVYGANQSKNFVISKFINQAKNNLDVTVYGDGLQTRCFIYIADNVDATVSALDKQESINQTINIGNDQEITMLDLAKLIIELTKSNSKIVQLPALVEGDMTMRKPDISKMVKILNTGSLISLRDGLNSII